MKKITHWYICAGINPYNRDKTTRKIPSAEAFSIMTILNDKYRKSDFHKEYQSHIQCIPAEVHETDGWKNKLAASRKIMAAEMAKSSSLRQALLEEYELNKDLLPFSIVQE